MLGLKLIPCAAAYFIPLAVASRSLSITAIDRELARDCELLQHVIRATVIDIIQSTVVSHLLRSFANQRLCCRPLHPAMLQCKCNQLIPWNHCYTVEEVVPEAVTQVDWALFSWSHMHKHAEWMGWRQQGCAWSPWAAGSLSKVLDVRIIRSLLWQLLREARCAMKGTFQWWSSATWCRTCPAQADAVLAILATLALPTTVFTCP